MTNDNLDQPFVSILINGQLGNQLFQIAVTLGYAWENNARPIFPMLNEEDKREARINNRNQIFFRLDTSTNPRPFINTFKEARYFNYEKIPFKPDLMLDGLFFSWKYFDKYRDKLLDILAPSEATTNYLNQYYSDLIKNQNTVGIHVRTRNRNDHNSRVHPTMSLEFYQSAMDHFSQESLFVIFSDKPQWAKEYFSTCKRNHIIIDDNYINELFLMSMMKNNITSNSSFGWWGPYLNRNPDKKVVTPSLWGGRYEYNYNDFLLPDWIRQPIPQHYWPYPPKLDLYPTKSLWEGQKLT